MDALPQLIEEDITQLDVSLSELLRQTGASDALITDRAGFVIARQGKTEGLDTVTLGALAANTYAAGAAIASLVGEPDFSSLYQEGTRQSLLINSLPDNALLIIVFGRRTTAGAVKYFAGQTVRHLVLCIKRAADRDPLVTIDLAQLNVADTTKIFRRKA